MTLLHLVPRAMAITLLLSAMVATAKADTAVAPSNNSTIDITFTIEDVKVITVKTERKAANDEVEIVVAQLDKLLAPLLDN